MFVRASQVMVFNHGYHGERNRGPSDALVGVAGDVAEQGSEFVVLLGV